MPKKATVKYRSLRTNLVHLPLSLYASLAQQQARPQSLILHLAPLVVASTSRSPPQAAYLGWSGLAAASSLAGFGGGDGETVEIDPEVALGLGWPEGTIVEISVIHQPVKAKSVTVTPLTSDDWEILEQHADFLENNLLGQLRAAKKGQLLDVWVMGRTKIRIKVDVASPETSINSAVLVTPDTEIYVAPRPRDSSSAKAQEQPVVLPTTVPVETSPKAKGKMVQMRLVPQRVALCWGEYTLSRGESALVGSDRVFLASTESLAWVRRKLGTVEDDRPLATKFVLNNSKMKSEANQTAEEEIEIKEAPALEQIDGWLVAWDEMPDGMVTIVEGIKEEWTRWGTVRISLSMTRRGKRDLSNGHIPNENLTPLAGKRGPRLAGVDQTVDGALSYLRRSAGSSSARPLLLVGGKGSGKTSISRLIGERLECNREILSEVMYEDVARVDPEAKVSSIKAIMDSWIEEATRRKPCLLILDGLDTLLRAENEVDISDSQKRLVLTMLQLTPSANPAILADQFCRLFSSGLPQNVIVLATATSMTNLHPLLSAKHVFGETVKIHVPTKEVRIDILESLVEDVQTAPVLKLNGAAPRVDLDFITLASMTEGYSASDLNDLVSGAKQQAVIRYTRAPDGELGLSPADFALAQAAFTPMSLRGVTLQKSEVKWSDIGGLHETRRVLRETLEWPTKYAQIFANCPLRLRSGLLLYGFPGCGKTLLASAVAKECGLNFISVKGPEILNKYIGASEKSVRDLFERASAAKPCVLFFDEFDSIAPKRGHDSTGVTDRVVNQMLTEMDGAQGLDGVYVLAATSRPDLIDPALLRPGRLDKSLLCDIPDEADRLEKLIFGSSVDLPHLAHVTEGFSGADLQALVYNAHLEVVHASISASAEEKEHKQAGQAKGKGKGKALVNGGPEKIKLNHRQVAPVDEKAASNAQKAEVTSRVDTIIEMTSLVEVGATESRPVHSKPVIEDVHLHRSLENTRPSVSSSDRARLERIYRAFVADRDGSMTNGDGGRDTGTRVSLM
ncbi:peroxin-1, partial [Tremellales sp. Uapishka_1]